VWGSVVPPHQGIHQVACHGGAVGIAQPQVVAGGFPVDPWWLWLVFSFGILGDFFHP